MKIEYGVSSLQILESLPRGERTTGSELRERLKSSSGPASALLTGPRVFETNRLAPRLVRV